jgi:hypothetical protein
MEFIFHSLFFEFRIYQKWESKGLHEFKEYFEIRKFYYIRNYVRLKLRVLYF